MECRLYLSMHGPPPIMQIRATGDAGVANGAGHAGMLDVLAGCFDTFFDVAVRILSPACNNPNAVAAGPHHV